MQILVNTDNHIQGGQALTSLVEATVQEALGRFGDRVTRVEVHLTDENSRAKESENDKRCVMEARLAGLEPITVSDQGATLEQVIDGAAERLVKTLTRTVERLDNPKGRTSFAGEQGT
jgi:ribosome-associated translation inhibitor RaiA